MFEVVESGLRVCKFQVMNETECGTPFGSSRVGDRDSMLHQRYSKTARACHLGAVVISVMLASCQTTSVASLSNSVYFIPKFLEFVDLSDRVQEVVGTFEITN